MPAPPGDAAGKGRDGADPRRPKPRRPGRPRPSHRRPGRRVSSNHVAVIGAGASGTIQMLHLLREGVGRVTLIEREREPGRGVAYGTPRPEHLLNVTASRMIVF